MPPILSRKGKQVNKVRGIDDAEIYRSSGEVVEWREKKKEEGKEILTALKRKDKQRDINSTVSATQSRPHLWQNQSGKRTYLNKMLLRIPS